MAERSGAILIKVVAGRTNVGIQGNLTIGDLLYGMEVIRQGIVPKGASSPIADLLGRKVDRSPPEA